MVLHRGYGRRSWIAPGPGGGNIGIVGRAQMHAVVAHITDFKQSWSVNWRCIFKL